MDLMTILMIVLPIGGLLYLLLDPGDAALERRLETIKEGLKKKDTKAEETKAPQYLMEVATKIAQGIVDKSKNLRLQSYKQLLLEGGQVSDDEAVLKYMAQKVMYGGVLGFFGVLIIGTGADAMTSMLMLIIAPVLGFRFPDMKLKSAAKKRAIETTYSLPDALDLLSVCVEAGLGLDSALSRVAKEQRKSAPILSQEFDRVTKDVLAGIPRSEAFRNLTKRNGSVELKSFVSLLIQSDKLGTSISQSLKVYSDALRIKRRQKAEEMAAKAGVKMSVPLVLFILPATFIVIMAPAAIMMYTMFTGGAMNTSP